MTETNPIAHAYERGYAAGAMSTCCEPADYSPVSVGDVLGHHEDAAVSTWRETMAPSPSGTILEDAQAAVYGDREDDYGHPREDFTRTAIIWTGLLQHKLADGEYIEAEDIARCMIGVKLSRDVHHGKRDNRVDGAGYFATLDRLETGK